MEKQLTHKGLGFEQKGKSPTMKKTKFFLGLSAFFPKLPMYRARYPVFFSHGHMGMGQHRSTQR